MAIFVQHDVECNRCHNVYQTFAGERELAILIEHTYLSICPKCSLEVAKAMGYGDLDDMKKQLAKIKEANTENNRKRKIEEGNLCKKCEGPFYEGEPRIRKSVASNVESWHIDCYEDK